MSNNKIEVKIEKYPAEINDDFEIIKNTFLCYSNNPLLKGVVETGDTKLEAFSEFMISLRNKIVHDNDFHFNNPEIITTIKID